MTELPRRRVPPVLVDVVLAVVVLVFAEIELRQSWDDGFRGGPLWLNAPLVALLVAPLALRTLAPRLGLGLMLAVAVLPGLLVAHTLLFWGGAVPILGMVFAVARRDDGPAGRHTSLAWPVLLLGGLRDPGWLAPGNLLFGLLAFGFTWWAGRLVRRMDRRREALATALARLAEEQSGRQDEAVARERSRIAIEMHDVVSHAVSLMVIQVGAARMELSRPGGSTTEAGQLLEAERTGREALDELRHSLGVLRGSSG